jgi:2-(1,2-epoxy-1,2-dihydrophenyl)acetyl-CoA isomerase
MTAPLVQLSRANGHARLTLARPERTNSLDDALLEDLLTALDELLADPPRALILAGEGALHDAILRLLQLPCPVIAQLQGATTGGALGLALAADLVVMRNNAFIQPYYAVVGFGPDGGWTALLPERIGVSRALGVQFLNRRIGAEEAFELGIASALGANDAELAAITEEWLATIASHVAGTLTATRRLVWDEERLRLVGARLDAERTAFIQRIQETETRLGMAAFVASLRNSRKG